MGTQSSRSQNTIALQVREKVKNRTKTLTKANKNPYTQHRINYIQENVP